MAIRDNQGRWTKEAYEVSSEIKKVLRPIFDHYKDRMPYEDIYYLVCNEIHEMILDDVIINRR